MDSPHNRGPAPVLVVPGNPQRIWSCAGTCKACYRELRCERDQQDLQGRKGKTAQLKNRSIIGEWIGCLSLRIMHLVPVLVAEILPSDYLDF